MRASPQGTSRRWRWAGGAATLAAALILVGLAFGIPGPQTGCGGPLKGAGAGPATSTGSRSLNARRNPVNGCRAAGGTCVGMEAGACARGPIGDAARYSCNSAQLQCCLPDQG